MSIQFFYLKDSAFNFQNMSTTINTRNSMRLFTQYQHRYICGFQTILSCHNVDKLYERYLNSNLLTPTTNVSQGPFTFNVLTLLLVFISFKLSTFSSISLCLWSLSAFSCFRSSYGVCSSHHSSSLCIGSCKNWPLNMPNGAGQSLLRWLHSQLWLIWFVPTLMHYISTSFN